MYASTSRSVLSPTYDLYRFALAYRARVGVCFCRLLHRRDIPVRVAIGEYMKLRLRVLFHSALRCSFCLLLAIATIPTLGDMPQEHVHNMSHGVMPFDMSKAAHIFAMTEQGGVQKVVTRNSSDADQVAMIQQHLKHEADAFQKGDFGDPAHLHGSKMPGLSDLQANAAQIRIVYSDLPNGAQIAFEAKDIHTITAIHRWFGAQLSEHGADATAE
jgi:hypothetical protein